jgi:transposase
MFVAVPEDRAQPNVRNYPTFTDDLCGLADWLKACGIENVAMEATGVYWIPIFQILEKRGFKVTLVNARHAKNVPGRKSDVRDSRWIQFLHSVGLLQGAFRPADEICALRAYMRHRDKLVAVAASHTLRMQKALTQMNIQIHNVISDITGVSGLAILDSILEGQRDPAVLASLCHSTIKADREVVRKSLVGDWRPEHLFALSQELRAYRFCQELIQECDTALERLLEQSVAARVAPDTTEQSVAARVAPDTIEQSEPVHEYFPPEPVKPRKNASVKTARISRLTTFLHALFGTDVTLVPGLAVEGVYKLYTELGPDLEAFPTDRHFCSYLGLCPDNRVSGGKVLSAKTRHVPSRAATIFRIAANSLDRSQTPLGDYLRRMKARLGKQEGITATAHKLARIFYHLVTTGETYDETRLQPTQSELKRRTKNLIRQATKLGYTVTPNLVPQ